MEQEKQMNNSIFFNWIIVSCACLNISAYNKTDQIEHQTHSEAIDTNTYDEICRDREQQERNINHCYKYVFFSRLLLI